MIKWELGFSERIDEEPKEFLQNAKTCEVARNYYEMGLLPDYNKGKNYLLYEWMENKFWHYQTKLFVKNKAGFNPFICFSGLDYEYEIYIDNILLIKDVGLFTPVKICLFDYINKEIVLKVIFYPIPKKPLTYGREQASLSVKPAVSYGWDFHPRLVPSGFYDEVVLKYEPNIKIEEFDIQYVVSDDFKSVSGKFHVNTNSNQNTLNVCMIDSTTTTVFSEKLSCSLNSEIDFIIENPLLWWCRDYGKQELYTISVAIEDQNGDILDTYKRRIGFRRVRLVMNEGAWEGDDFPKTQGKAPITLELNGKRIFAKGTNLVPPEIFSSLSQKANYKELLSLVYDCNMNLVRMWGGGIVNKEPFFELCDEMGIMVWQEFPLSCNRYDDDDNYLKVLDKESRSIINRLKKHPCLVIWCGGNELFCSWGGMSNQSHALRLLDKNCYELDRNTPFLMTSPLYGMGHGHYMPINSKSTEVYTDIVNSSFTAYTEFGMPSPSPIEYLKTFMEENELYDMTRDSVWDHHHGVSAWDMVSPSWFCTEHIKMYYGTEQTFEELIQNGLSLQSEIYKNIFEEVRRKAPYASMALNWCFNDPWPTAANNSIVNYPAIPKPSYESVKKSLQNILFSVRFNKMIWDVGDRIDCEMFLLNDLIEEINFNQLEILIYNSNREEILNIGKFNFKYQSKSVCKLFDFSINVNENFSDLFYVIIKSNKKTENEYALYIPNS